MEKAEKGRYIHEEILRKKENLSPSTTTSSLNNSIFARNQGEITQSNHDQPLRNPRVSKIILN